MIEAREDVDLVTLRRQGDLDRSRQKARRMEAASPEPPEREGALTLAPEPVAAEPQTAPGRDWTDVVVWIALALAMVAAFVQLARRTDRRTTR